MNVETIDNDYTIREYSLIERIIIFSYDSFMRTFYYKEIFIYYNPFRCNDYFTIVK